MNFLIDAVLQKSTYLYEFPDEIPIHSQPIIFGTFQLRCNCMSPTPFKLSPSDWLRMTFEVYDTGCQCERTIFFYINVWCALVMPEKSVYPSTIHQVSSGGKTMEKVSTTKIRNKVVWHTLLEFKLYSMSAIHSLLLLFAFCLRKSAPSTRKIRKNSHQLLLKCCEIHMIPSKQTRKILHGLNGAAEVMKSGKRVRGISFFRILCMTWKLWIRCKTLSLLLLLMMMLLMNNRNFFMWKIGNKVIQC